jgi:hypothetical protein
MRTQENRFFQLRVRPGERAPSADRLIRPAPNARIALRARPPLVRSVWANHGARRPAAAGALRPWRRRSIRQTAAMDQPAHASNSGAWFDRIPQRLTGCAQIPILAPDCTIASVILSINSVVSPDHRGGPQAPSYCPVERQHAHASRWRDFPR